MRVAGSLPGGDICDCRLQLAADGGGAVRWPGSAGALAVREGWRDGSTVQFMAPLVGPEGSAAPALWTALLSPDGLRLSSGVRAPRLQ